MARNDLSSYVKTRASTAGPGQRVVMVYDGIIKNIKLAIAMLEAPQPEDFEKINNALQLASRLIFELKMALDKKNGGELATRLEGLYDFWIDQISDANIKKDGKIIVPTLGMVEELRDSWDKADQELRKTGK